MHVIWAFRKEASVKRTAQRAFGEVLFFSVAFLVQFTASTSFSETIHGDQFQAGKKHAPVQWIALEGHYHVWMRHEITTLICFTLPYTMFD